MRILNWINVVLIICNAVIVVIGIRRKSNWMIPAISGMAVVLGLIALIK